MTTEEKQTLVLNIHLFYALTYFCGSQSFMWLINAGKGHFYQKLS